MLVRLGGLELKLRILPSDFEFRACLRVAAGYMMHTV